MNNHFNLKWLRAELFRFVFILLRANSKKKRQTTKLKLKLNLIDVEWEITYRQVPHQWCLPD